MPTLLIVLIVIGLLFVLLAAEYPVAFSLLAAGTVGLVLLSGTGVANSILQRQSYSVLAKYTLVVIPMFIAMGAFAKHGGMAQETFRLAARYLDRVPGGLALAALFACAGFAAVSGSSVATVVSVGRLSIQEMRRHGYDPAFAAGVVGAAGTLGVLIPPSIVLVIYGILTGESIGALLIAGIIPGVASAIFYALAIIYRAHRNPEMAGALTRALDKADEAEALEGEETPLAPDGDRPPLTGGVHDTGTETQVVAAPVLSETDIAVLQKPVGFGGLVRIGVLFTVVVGGIYSGTFTAIESAAMGAAVALIILALDNIRDIRGLWTTFRASVIEAVSMTSMIFALLIGAGVFSMFTVSAALPQTFTRWALGLDLPATMIVIVLLLAFVPLGMFLDPLSIMLIGVPLAYPVVTSLGFDGIWFGILVVKAVEIGLITPPVGINAYVVAGTAEDISVETAFRGILWFLPIDVITVAVLFAFPAITTWLPGVVRG